MGGIQRRETTISTYSGADGGGHEEDLVEVDEVDHDGNATDKVDKDETFHPGGEKLSL